MCFTWEKQEPEDFREFWSLSAKVHDSHIINLLSWAFKSLQNTHSAFNSNKNYELQGKLKQNEKDLGTHYAVLVEKVGHFLEKAGPFRKMPVFFSIGQVFVL